MEKKKGRREGRERGRAGGRERKEGRKKGQRKERRNKERKEKNGNYVIIGKDGDQIVDCVLPEEAGVYPGQGDTHVFCICIFPTAVLGFFYN